MAVVPYLVMEGEGTGNRVFGEVLAASPVDALARFAIAQGYADPRETTRDGEEDAFFYHEGNVWMVHENLQLIAAAL